MSKRIESKNLWNEQEIKDSAKNISKAIKDIEKQLGSIVTVLNKSKQAFNENAKSQAGLKKQTEQLTTLDREIIKLDKQMERAEAQLTNEYKQVQKAVLAKKEAVRKSNEELKKQQGITRKTGGLFKSMTKSILTAGAAFLSFGTAIRILKDIGKVVIDFSKAQSNLASILGKSKNEIRDLTEDAKKYGAVTKFTASEVSGLQTELAKLGFTQAEIKNSTSSILDLAAATNADLASAANVAGSALRAFNLDATETERVSSVLAVATTKSALTFQDYGSIIGNVAPIANKFGLSIEDTVAVLGKLRDSGFDASKSAIAFRNILLKLADPASELSKRFGGAATSSEELFTRLKTLQDEGANLADLLKLTDVRAAGAFSTIVSGVDSVNDLKESITGANEQLKEMVDTQLDNLSGDLKIARSAWEGLILSFEDGSGIISTIVRSAVQDFTKQLGTITQLAKGIDVSTIEELTSRFQKATDAIKKQEGAQKALDVIEKAREINLAKIASLESEQENAGRKRTKEIEKELKQRNLILSAQENVINGIQSEVQAVKDAEEKKIKAKEQAAARERKILQEQENKFTELQLKNIKTLTDRVNAQYDKRAEKFTNWLEKSNELFNDDIVEQIEAEENVTQKIEEEQKKRLKIYQDEAKSRKELDELYAQDRQALEDGLMTIITTSFDNFIDANLAKFEADQEAKKDIQKNRLDKGQITEEQYQKRIAEIERQSRIKAAQAEKKKQLFQIGIDTASAIIKQASVTPLPLGLPFILAVGSLGLTQASTVAATPIPKFFKGVTDFMGGPAVVGDSAAGGSQTELVKLVSGEQFIIKNPTLMDLPRGASVFTEQSKETREAVKGLDDTNIIKGLSRIEKKLSGNGGGLYWTGKGLERRDIINRNIVILRGRRSK